MKEVFARDTETIDEMQPIYEPLDTTNKRLSPEMQKPSSSVKDDVPINNDLGVDRHGSPIMSQPQDGRQDELQLDVQRKESKKYPARSRKRGRQRKASKKNVDQVVGRDKAAEPDDKASASEEDRKTADI